MLFPGIDIVLLAALGLLSAIRPVRTVSAPPPMPWRWQVAVYATILAAALWLAAGPSAPGPYGLLLRVLPGFDGLRVPARFIVIVALALSVLGSAGAAWLLSRVRPRAGLAVVIVLGAAIMLEGYGGPMYMVPFRHDQPVRAQLNQWMRNGPPGGVLELPIAGPAIEPFTLGYQYNTLLHHRPVVNGYSGYGYGLQDFLGGPGSPLSEPNALPGLVDGLRAIGVRYLVVQRALYADRPELGWGEPKALVDFLDRAAGQPGRTFNNAVAWDLGASHPRLPVDEPALEPIALRESMVTASAMPDRLRYAFDGDIDTKWLSAAPQSGAEWMRVAFGEALDAGRLEVLTSRFGVGDYPRSLVVESETTDGTRMTLFSGSFLPSLLRGLATGRADAPAVLDLPSNRSRALWVRQTGRSRTWQWAVHELRVYRRRAG
jgi:hypothetical protein